MISHIASSVRFTRTVVVALVASALGASVSYAQVPTQDDAIPQINVNYSDLNLATEAGSRALYHRLVAAAEHVCPSRGHPAELRYNREVHRCITDTVDRAVKGIDHPRFAQVAAAHTR